MLPLELLSLAAHAVALSAVLFGPVLAAVPDLMEAADLPDHAAGDAVGPAQQARKTDRKKMGSREVAAVEEAAEEADDPRAAATATGDRLHPAQAAAAEMTHWTAALAAAWLTVLDPIVEAVLCFPQLAAAAMAPNTACLCTCL